MTSQRLVRTRVIAEAAGPALREYQELHDLELAGDLYEAVRLTLEGYAEMVAEHADMVGQPTAMVVIVEPFNPTGDTRLDGPTLPKKASS